MKGFDGKTWERFDLFGENGFLRIATTNSSIDSIRLKDGDEKVVPYITRSESSNGVAQFVSENNYEFGFDEAGCITVGLDTQTAFYQPHKFVTGQNIQIITGDSLDKDNAYFYITILLFLKARRHHLNETEIFSMYVAQDRKKDYSFSLQCQ